MGVARQTMKIAPQSVEIAPKFEKSHSFVKSLT